MTPYGKTAQTAIAAISRLAEMYDPVKRVKLNSAEIAENRKMPQPVVAKVLTILSQAGLVNGSPGPGGGYWLARNPEMVTLYDVVSLFERQEENVSCPFGPHYCGTGPHCPMHFDLLKVREQMISFLRGCSLARFVGWKPGQPATDSHSTRQLPILPMI
ncbi:RrF2 family transcriptional regulator [Tuwongella immobilis]|uniref:Rrf2 family transcriptional regulator n=1 Tax=Tuwongella immobilis TaxID=692036 RepID=A0A6C2YN39_9BACT|nr:Rrf2 family transcriptional regulator [Tuwongella immobilis]VIP02856.1 Transcriptional regulator, BadM/Rrf2 family OS=Coraliomargarita akajimensis (strain DSM 45221 / IAM 15411 / JCM 23193 / KCTC 12865) GN=Caka_0069 PE=4 SV=1: Rrf2 [Tuwongella immobilis]VTS02656.1 Transcriptional regulator, BadM/Rrf2 family OS=Coraliomargarita akajimensis (strain DSM 45221 / IAM 15411 / JCM 23193 / KCTC 12865) GN=Caka_0069 PE=4 SV=1: Rrf2 [Tuwongella immobilis]